MVWVAQARVAAHRGDIPAARQALAYAQRLRPLNTYALPPQSVLARIELIRVYLALADLTGARTLMREIDDLLRRRPLSRNTVSSQAMSVYRKLAVGSRSQAVVRSRELGLLEG